MGDQVAVMRSGKLVQVGDPLTIYDGPVDRFVGGFIGNPPMNFLPVLVERRDGAAVAVLADSGEIRVEGDEALGQRVGPMVLGIRAENVQIVGSDESAALRGRVLVVEPLGSHNLVTLALGSEHLKAITRPDERLEPDQDVGLKIDPGRVRWLDTERGVAFDAEDVAGPGAGRGALTDEERDAAAG